MLGARTSRPHLRGVASQIITGRNGKPQAFRNVAAAQPQSNERGRNKTIH